MSLSFDEIEALPLILRRKYIEDRLASIESLSRLYEKSCKDNDRLKAKLRDESSPLKL